MKPDESAEVEMIETRDLTALDIFTEQGDEGVTITFALDDHDEDLAILLTHENARELGEALFRLGCA